MIQMQEAIDWDTVPDDQLEETWVERLEGLKEMFPPRVRSTATKTAEWSRWLAGNTVFLF
jgi:hypothetical protein